MKSLTLIAKRWSSGTNTYHTVVVLIDGRFAYKSDVTYGYGSHFEVTAMKWLKSKGYATYEPDLHPWRYCQLSNIRYYCEVIDVQRKKEL